MLQNNNIHITDVRNELGETSNDLGTLCQSPLINRWSRWKPVQINQFEAITEEQLKQINYGYDNMQFDSPYTAYEFIELNNAWSYIPPVNYFRLGDFRTYDGNAKPPYQMEIQSAGSGCVGDNINFSFQDNIQELREWNIINNDLSLNIGLLLKRNGTIYFHNCGNIQDVDGEKLTLKITNTLPLGDYNIIPVYTNKTDVALGTTIVISKMENNFRWVVLPAAPLIITVTDKPQFNPFDYIQISAPDIATFEYGIDNIGEYVTNINLNFTWEITPDYPNKAMNLDLEVIYRNAINDGTTSNITLYRNSHTNCNTGYISEEPISYNKKIYVASIKEGELKLYLYMKCYIDQMTYENNYYEFTLTQTNLRANKSNIIIKKI